MGTPTTKYIDVDANKSSKSNPIEKREIKFIENRSDKKICTEIDKLNESVYNLNSFLRLSKDIDDIKKENLVKNDIQHKLSLKSQWLSAKYGSTSSLNALTKNRPNCKISDDQIIHNSEECLKKTDISPEKFGREKSPKYDSTSIHSLASIKGNTSRLYKSFDELRVKMEPIMMTDVEQDEKVNSKKSQAVKFTENNKLNSKKLIELKNTIDRVKFVQAKYVEPKPSTDPAKRDLSRYFPPKNITVRSQKVKENPKELKDIDLSKYFMPTPVQELKSIPSPGNSPQLNRRMISKAQHQGDNLISNSPGTSTDWNSQGRDNLKKSEFKFKDQHAVNSVESRIPKESLMAEPDNTLSDRINEINDTSEYTELVESIRSPIDNVDEIFGEVAADFLESPIGSENLRCQKIEDEMRNSNILKPSDQISQPSPDWHRKPMSSGTTFDDVMLSKLSENLLKAVEKLEKDIQTGENVTSENEAKQSTEKLDTKNYSKNTHVGTSNIEIVLKPDGDPAMQELCVDNNNQDKSSIFNKHATEFIDLKENDSHGENYSPLNINSLDERTMRGNMSNDFSEHMGADENIKLTEKSSSLMNSADAELSSSHFTIEHNKHDFEKNHPYTQQTQRHLQQNRRTSNPISNTNGIVVGQTNMTAKDCALTNIILDCNIPCNIRCQRKEHLIESVKPLETVSTMNNIVKILKDGNVQNTHFSGENISIHKKENSSSFNDPCSSKQEKSTDKIPSRPQRTKKKDRAELLIERSRRIHNAKQEFINEKLFGSNPYLKKKIVIDSGDNVNDKNQQKSISDSFDATIETDKNHGLETSNLMQNSVTAMPETNKKPSSLQSLDTITPSTTNLNVFDLFKRNSPNNKQIPSGKDGCIVS